MPTLNMATAMELYQPSGMKGRMVKRLFPFLHWLSPVRKLLQSETLHCSLRNDLYKLLCQLFEVDKLEFSIFGGTPCTHQKITIQLSRGKHILGYCKVSDNAEISSLFYKEKSTLDALEKKGVFHIPQGLYCGLLQDGMSVFVQSTIKTSQSRVVHSWTNLQEQFLSDLCDKTKQNLVFENTDYYQSLIDLKQHLNWLPKNVDQDIVDTVIEQVLNGYKEQEVAFSAYHGDFTPWNMFLESEQLFVFDWEYAQMTYPPYLDYFHFFTQTAIFEKHWNEKQIIEAYSLLPKNKQINDKQYCYYLLDIISRFTLRENGKFQGDIAQCMTIWTKLLIFLR